MASDLVSLLGEKLLKGDGAELNTGDVLAGKAACILYFSAHWCPPCRGFTPTLAQAYKDYKSSGGAEAEVVFISWDRDDKSFKEYFCGTGDAGDGGMPWLALPFEGTADNRKLLGSKFEVDGIPALVVLGSDGKLLHPRGDNAPDLRQLVSAHKDAAFPLTPARLVQLKAEQAEETAAVLKELTAGTLFPPICGIGGGDSKMQVSQLLGVCEHLGLLFGDGDGSDATYAKVTSVVDSVNRSGGDKLPKERLGMLYVGWTLYNENSDHAPLATKHHALLGPSEELKAKLATLSGGGVGPPHLLILGRSSSGTWEVAANDPGCQRIGKFGAEGYPWSDVRVAELEAIAKERVEAVKLRQTNLQFLKGSAGRETLATSDGKQVSVDDLASEGPEAVVGLYFSAHWCPPCRGFTPKLAECYNELKADGRKFEVVFISSDQNEDAFKEYFQSMPWLALPYSERGLKDDLSSIFQVQGIPTLVLLKPDGTLISQDGREAVGYGPEAFPWGPEEMKKGQAAAKEKAAKKKEDAIKAEKAAEEAQTAKGGPVLRRIRGTPGSAITLDVEQCCVEFQSFGTVGAPNWPTPPGGVIYYEIEVLAAEGIPQFGFATSEFKAEDDYSGDGVGDDNDSWGVDGTRNVKWHGGETTAWGCSWATGDIIGIAANVATGKMAVSKNGSWSDEPCGVVFEHDGLKAGIYPALTASGYKVRYNFDGQVHGPYAHGPPPESFW